MPLRDHFRCLRQARPNLGNFSSLGGCRPSGPPAYSWGLPHPRPPGIGEGLVGGRSLGPAGEASRLIFRGGSCHPLDTPVSAPGGGSIPGPPGCFPGGAPASPDSTR